MGGDEGGGGWGGAEVRSAGLHFIMAFPNEMAFLPLTRLARFRLLDTARFVEGDIEGDGYMNFLRSETRKLFLTDRLVSWRLSHKPYRIESGRVLKEFEGYG